jgi:hypothetical protein
MRTQRVRRVNTACPRWDSNPHCGDFKSPASADWATGARAGPYWVRPAASAARDMTSSSIAGVSRPVKVFCWLTW